MKSIFKYIFGFSMLVSLYSCKKDLDINTNPNSVTVATVDLVLPNSIVATANSLERYNFMGGQQVGYFANGGGVSGWAGIISYNWTTGDFAGNWATTYDVLTDVQYVIANSEGNASFKEFNAAAKVLKAYNYSLLVDTYNDIPYTEALQGDTKLQPKYDKATDIYKSLVDLLDQSIATFKAAGTGAGSKLFVTADPLFAGNLGKWAAFAQTLKLKLVIKGQGKVTFSNTTFDSAVGFITDDAIVQPGYTKVENKQNPFWNAWAYNAAGTAVGAASNYAVTSWMLTFYNGTKISDPARAGVTYQTGLSVPTNQLGYQQADAGRGLAPSSWFRGSSATTYEKIGILKGPDAGQPIMLAAESYFLQAEANVKGLLAGSAATNFDLGENAAFRYLYKDNTGAVNAGKDAVADATTYRTTNTANPLANFAVATTDAQKLEAIITQKYIAFNMLFGHEAWNEYRRTGYPTIVVSPTPNRLTSFVSIVSQSTAADKLPTRVQYPANEFKYNASNVPAVNVYSSKIFWAK
ncbi:SusD/RagB family nutrient-binding outer membrane lipoprotein [Pedobacter sp. GSP4]|uniref:SusD/RagB family nutrient-binding outer membrane lipoprotein n=1 Tax=Pedobacter sp. GSP4 TaxID=3453716 RepID=UPI003EED8911